MPINARSMDPRTGLPVPLEKAGNGRQPPPAAPTKELGEPGQPAVERVWSQPRREGCILPAGTDLSVPIAFPVRSFIASNYSNQWAYIVEANDFVAPGEKGAILYGNHAQTVTAQWRAPDLVTQYPNPAGNLYLIATEEVLDYGPGEFVPGVDKAHAPTVYNVTLTLANTEYSQALPVNCRGFDMQPRTGVDVRFAFVTGKVATPVAPYATMKLGAPYNSPPTYQPSGGSTVYLGTATAGTVVEIVVWV